MAFFVPSSRPSDALQALMDAGVERGLTLYPEWAFAVAWLGKRIENRSGPIPSTIRPGTKIAIHAGAAAGKVGGSGMVAAAEAAGWSWSPGVFQRDGEVIRLLKFEVSCIVAVATLGECYPPEPRRGPWHVQGYYGWELRDVERVYPAVPMPGGQGLWTLVWAHRRAIAAEIVRGCQ